MRIVLLSASGKSPNTCAISAPTIRKELIGIISATLLVADVFAGTDAQQNVVRMLIALPQIVHVVRRGAGKFAIGARPMLTMR